MFEVRKASDKYVATLQGVDTPTLFEVTDDGARQKSIIVFEEWSTIELERQYTVLWDGATPKGIVVGEDAGAVVHDETPQKDGLPEDFDSGIVEVLE